MMQRISLPLCIVMGFSNKVSAAELARTPSFCLGMCEQDAFAEHHVIAVTGQQRDDAVDVTLDDEVALQERLACVLDGILPGWFRMFRGGRNLAAAVGYVLQQGVRLTLSTADFHLMVLPVEIVVQSS